MGFKYDDKHKDFKNISKKLDDILKTIHDNKNKQEKIVDIFPDYVLPKNFVNSLIELNRLVSNQQLKSINEIVKFVKKEIYSGDEYHERREKQMEGSNYWINLFFAKSSTENKEQYNNIVSNVLLKVAGEIKELENNLVHVESQN